jgi:hypothetical protein
MGKGAREHGTTFRIFERWRREDGRKRPDGAQLRAFADPTDKRVGAILAERSQRGKT